MTKPRIEREREEDVSSVQKRAHENLAHGRGKRTCAASLRDVLIRADIVE